MLAASGTLPELLAQLLTCTQRGYANVASSISNISHQHIIEALLTRDLSSVSRLLALDIGLTEKEAML